MKTMILGLFMAITTSGTIYAKSSKNDFYNLESKTIRGKKMSFDSFKGKVVLIVNTASKCGYTPQYEGLEAVHKKYEAKGLKIVGFPSNDFGGQEPGSEKEIVEFCKFNYGVSFDMGSKVKTKGAGQSSVYKFLTSSAAEKGDVKWNFEKFLVNRKGEVVGRFRSSVKPESAELTKAIESALKG